MNSTSKMISSYKTDICTDRCEFNIKKQNFSNKNITTKNQNFQKSLNRNRATQIEPFTYEHDKNRNPYTCSTGKFRN